MDFTCIVLFLGIYYLKPQEWTALFATVRFAQLTMFASVASLMSRPRGLKLADFFRTPHDWAMLLFFAWVVFASPTPYETFKEFLNRIVFYVVIVQTLISWDRIKRFLGWWTGMIVAVAFLAIAGEYFFDPLGSRDLTHGIMRDRLVLNLSMVNNPNALGHTVVPVISMLYFFCIWKRPIFMKEIGLVAFLLPLWCVYLTFSKGAYLAGASAILASFTFGRPKIVQAAIVAIALIGGVTAVQSLPRMGELQKSKTDEAIQGRIKAFTHGRTYYETLDYGVGQGNFIKSLLADHNYYKAAHSTYVQTGAELGKIGMFLFLLLIWVNFRTLVTAKTRTVEQERIRRVLFVLLLTYCVSGWMVDFAYRATFFMFTAAIAAFHRLLYQITPEVTPEEVEKEPELPWRSTVPLPLGPSPVGGGVAAAPVLTLAPVTTMQKSAYPWLHRNDEPAPDAPQSEEEPKSFWNRLGIIDVIGAYVFLRATEYFWTYAIQNF
jgi:hypothetical protein